MGEANVSHFETCCRLCLMTMTAADTTCRSIFEVDRTLPAKIATALTIHINADDKCTTKVCEKCTKKLNDWFEFKQMCTNNQAKIDRWSQNNDSSSVDMTVQVKSEPLEPDIDIHVLNPEVIMMNGGHSATLKYESPQMVGGYREGRATHSYLSLRNHHRNGNVDDAADRMRTADSNSGVNSSRQCSICQKVFSSLSNRKKHERTIHAPRPAGGMAAASEPTMTGHDEDHSQNSVESSANSTTVEQQSTAEEEDTADMIHNDIDRQKIQFAAGLKLLQRNNSTQPPMAHEALSKIEYSYIDKCKAMTQMLVTFRCACHNELHANAKRLLSHLRSLRIWFPVFTCYNCMITFTDRSSKTRHHTRCPRTNMETLIKLANLRRRTDLKTRIYQNYKCTVCRFMFSFHQDYCTHVDEEHCDVDLPAVCTCGRVFNTVEDYKDHAYVSCLVDYYCDVCFITVPTLDQFQRHAAEAHDTSEGFTLLQDDNYRRRKPLPAPPPPVTGDSVVSSQHISAGGEQLDRVTRKSTGSLPKVTDRNHYSPTAAPTPMNGPGGGGSGPNNSNIVNTGNNNSNVHIVKPTGLHCPICSKIYSTNNNMFRHYKSHLQSPSSEMCNGGEMAAAGMKAVDDSLYCCPDCGGMFQSGEWDAHKVQHKPPPCNECGKQFQFQTELDHHRNVHLNLKVYKDSKTQSYKSQMLDADDHDDHDNDDDNDDDDDNDNDNTNSSSVMVMCEVCEKMFTSKEQLRKHKLVHDKQQPCLTNASTPTTGSSVVSASGENTPPAKYYCAPCDKIYAGYSGLWDHNAKKHPELHLNRSNNFPKQCKYCVKMFTTGGSYAIHRRMHERMQESVRQKSMGGGGGGGNGNGHHRQVEELSVDDESESYFTCKRCFKVFSSRYSLKNHMKCHGLGTSTSSAGGGGGGGKPKPKTKKVWCDICHVQFENILDLRQHKHVEHNLRPPQALAPSLNGHGRSHGQEMRTAPFVYTCDLCVQTFTSKLALRKHKVQHKEEYRRLALANKRSVMLCRYCKITFKTFEQFAKHMRVEHAESRVQQQQQHRTKPNNSNNNNNNNNKGGSNNATAGTKKHKCPICAKAFDTAVALYSHQGWHKRGKMALKRMRDDNPAGVVVKREAPDPEARAPFTCSRCFTVLASDTALQLHILEKHRNVNATVLPARCTTCSLDFSTQEEYEKHRAFHNSLTKLAKSFGCAYCSATFTKLELLNQHVAKSHPKPEFKCAHCSRTFDKQNSLSIHMKVHDRLKNDAQAQASAKKLYSCSICNKGFDIPKELRQHTIQAHPF